MAVLARNSAVPGYMWPGFARPAEPALALAAGTVTAVFWAGEARGRWAAGGLAMYSQSVLSTAYVQVPVTAFGTAGTYNPTGDTVQFAFTPVTYPVTEPSSWATGLWATFPGPAYWALCLVGPASGGTALSIGSYQIWLKITDSPEVPVLQPSLLKITP